MTSIRMRTACVIDSETEDTLAEITADERIVAGLVNAANATKRRSDCHELIELRVIGDIDADVTVRDITARHGHEIHRALRSQFASDAATSETADITT